jgi:hypothetical protein
MIWYIVAAWLYIVGLIGLHAVSRDLQQHPIRTVRARLNLLFWPATVACGFILDIYDAIMAIRRRAQSETE